MELLDMMEQGLSFHFKDGKHIKPTSCSVIGDIYKVWWRWILSLSNWLHCGVQRKVPIGAGRAKEATTIETSDNFSEERRKARKSHRSKNKGV